MQHPLRNVVAATSFPAGAQAAELQAGLTLVHVFERDFVLVAPPAAVASRP